MLMTGFSKKITLLIVLAFCTLSIPLVFSSGSTSAAGRKISFIRDAETESTIRAYATPLFEAAGLDPSAIQIYLVKDNTLNAFVAGGQKLFLNTGLLVASDDAAQLIGVIAHETGHISGGHLSRIHAALRNSSAVSIVGAVLGAVAAAAAGRSDVGGALLMGGIGMGQRTFLHYSRTQEAAADQAALRLLEATKQSAQGLRNFMEKLVYQEQLSASRQDPYLRSHPLSRERIDAIDTHLAKSSFSAAPITTDFTGRHARMKAKLQAFLQPPGRTLAQYKEGDLSVKARYAKAIAYYRRPDLKKAIPLINSLISEYPKDPYFHELKGQILFENARPEEALLSYQTAVDLLPEEPLLRSELAQVQIELNRPELLSAAITNLRTAIFRQPRMPFSWHQLAIAYGRTGQMGQSVVALAEEAFLRGRSDDAIYQAARAQTLLPAGSPGWIQAQDIMEAARKQNQQDKR
jgi:predicted Zn-dependent protease